MLEVGCGPDGKDNMGVSEIWKLLLQHFSGVLVISALICGTDLFNCCFLSICFVQRSVLSIWGEICCSPPCRLGRGEGMCWVWQLGWVYDGKCCQSEWPGCPCLWGRGGHLRLGSWGHGSNQCFRKITCLSSFYFESLFLNLHQFWGEKGLLFVGRTLEKDCVQKKVMLKTEWLPEFWT